MSCKMKVRENNSDRHAHGDTRKKGIVEESRRWHNRLNAAVEIKATANRKKQNAVPKKSHPECSLTGCSVKLCVAGWTFLSDFVYLSNYVSTGMNAHRTLMWNLYKELIFQNRQRTVSFTFHREASATI